MAMTDAMEDVCYEKRNFNYHPRNGRHPMWVTEKHYVYPLCVDSHNRLICMKNAFGNPYRTPRRLDCACIYKMITEGYLQTILQGNNVPSYLYPAMLCEAILQREGVAIVKLISRWPLKYLHVYEVLPLEDYLDDDYLNQRLDNTENTTLLDCFIFGLLKLKPGNKLRFVDFTKLDKDRRLCRELCRLPILWMKLSDRTPERVHDLLTETLDITKDKVQKFLNKMSVVYSNIDAELEHGRKIDPLTFIVDMKVSMDDVPIGLGLQGHTPFKFSSDRLWIKQLPDISFLPWRIQRVFDLPGITHLELEHTWQSNEDNEDQTSLVYLLKMSPQLSALSLPRCIDVDMNKDAVEQINDVLRRLRNLQRLNFSYCNLRGHLEKLLEGLTQKFVYFNLKDCRLSQEDVFCLSFWSPLCELKELNLSCNSLGGLEEILFSMLRSMYCLVCLSVSYCGLTFESQVQLISQLCEYDYIKVLCMQGYTPLPWSEVHDLLFYCSQITTLQKILLFPEAYAYPGSNDTEREENKKQMILLSYRYLRGRRRIHMRLE